MGVEASCWICVHNLYDAGCLVSVQYFVVDSATSPFQAYVLQRLLYGCFGWRRPISSLLASCYEVASGTVTFEVTSSRRRILFYHVSMLTITDDSNCKERYRRLFTRNYFISARR